MSLLLDALQKSERERHAGQAPALDDLMARPAAKGVTTRDPLRGLRIATLLAAIAVLVFGGLQIWRPRPTAAAPATVVATPTPTPTPTPTLPEPVAPAASMRIDAERLQSPMLESSAVANDSDLSMDDLGAPPAAAPLPMATPAPAPPSEPADVPPAKPIQPPASEPSPPPSAKPLKDWPSGFRASFPHLTIDVHAYDPNPLRRFVLINGKKYREGDTLLEGPTLTEITPRGLIVEQSGNRVLLDLPRQDNIGNTP